jgi:hypothetical protein
MGLYNATNKTGGIMVRKMILAVVVIAVAGIGVWYYMENLSSTSIGEIIANPRNFDGKVTTISGEVTDRASLVFVRYFTLKDKTGEIIVATKRPLPAVGTKVRVQGKVEEAFSIGTEQKLVFVEVTEASKGK